MTDWRWRSLAARPRPGQHRLRPNCTQTNYVENNKIHERTLSTYQSRDVDLLSVLKSLGVARTSDFETLLKLHFLGRSTYVGKSYILSLSVILTDL